jgi:hypothetical protein
LQKDKKKKKAVARGVSARAGLALKSNKPLHPSFSVTVKSHAPPKKRIENYICLRHFALRLQKGPTGLS